MEIDFEVMLLVAERLEEAISKGALNATVTIGTGKCGNVFRLQVLSPEDAEEEDVADVTEWSRCIATSNV
jgi:hypothetical protein